MTTENLGLRIAALAEQQLVHTNVLAEELAALSPEERDAALGMVEQALDLLPDAYAQRTEAGKPQPRPLMVPCPACPDGFTTVGDRHARTAKDVCPRCGGTHQVPAATGTSAETSAPPVNGNGAGTDCSALPNTGKVFPGDANEGGTVPAGSFLDPVPVLYTNHRGETRVRQLAPSLAPGGPLVWCNADQWHPAGWRIRCLDAEAQHHRLYPIASILAWGAEAIEKRKRQISAENSLVALGWGHQAGTPLWRPSLGPAPDFEAADNRRQLAADLRALCVGVVADLPEVQTLLHAAEALNAVPLARGRA